MPDVRLHATTIHPRHGEHQLMPSAFPISLFNHARDNQPKLRMVSIAALTRALTHVPVTRAPRKTALPAWAPARFVPGETRRSESVIEVSCLVLDYDSGDPIDALTHWRGVFAVVHSTWSNTLAAPHFRLVIPLAAPVPVASWRWVWTWATSRAPGADRRCCDPGRMYFLPARPTPGAPYFADVQDGALLDARQPLADAERRRHAPRMPYGTRRVGGDHLGEDGAQRERVAVAAGATLTGAGAARRATHASCPACGRASVWFYISPERLRRARCNHVNSCGWTGPIRDLTVGGAR
jgi:predicted RNA-binding Zn-ribbon protein involved in translation (DUF1610 family)